MNPASFTLVIATTNRGKLREVSEVLAGMALTLRNLADFPGIEEAVEDGATFEENASIKAIHYARLTNCWTLADDSGLCVDALGGAPGVHSARYAGMPSNDVANNRKLIDALRAVPMNLRTARFVCAMALAKPRDAKGGDATVVATARGEVAGVIIDTPRGRNGFGYDPHFLIPALDKTAAELPPEQKNAISHRGNALRNMSDSIRRFCTAPVR